MQPKTKKQTIMSLSLTKELKDYVKLRAKSAHYGTPSDYMRSLIRKDIRQAEQEKLEKELIKGINSGKGIAMTPKQWSKLRSDVRSRIEKS